MRDTEYLLITSKSLQMFSNGAGHFSTDTGVYFIKYQCIRFIRCCKHCFKRQHHTRQLSSRRYFVKRLDRFPRIGTNQKLNGIKTIYIGTQLVSSRLRRRHLHGKNNLGHAEMRQNFLSFLL